MDKKTMATMRSSKNPCWETPQWVFDLACTQYDPIVDMAADAINTKCETWYEINDDGLSVPWYEPWWCNPPYGRGIDLWAKKAAQSSAAGCMLLPARTGTRWFRLVWERSTACLFFYKQIRFVGAAANAPFPSVLAFYNVNVNGYNLREHGRLVRNLHLTEVSYSG